MARTTKYFRSTAEYEAYLGGKSLPSGVIPVILTEDGDDVATLAISTTNIDGKFDTFVCVGDQAYSELLQQYNEKVQELKQANETIGQLRLDLQAANETIGQLRLDLAAANETIGQLRLDLAAATATIEAADTALQAI